MQNLSIILACIGLVKGFSYLQVSDEAASLTEATIEKVSSGSEHTVRVPPTSQPPAKLKPNNPSPDVKNSWWDRDDKGPRQKRSLSQREADGVPICGSSAARRTTTTAPQLDLRQNKKAIPFIGKSLNISDVEFDVSGHKIRVRRSSYNLCQPGYHWCTHNGRSYRSDLSIVSCTGGFQPDDDFRISDVTKEVTRLWDDSKYLTENLVSANKFPMSHSEPVCEALGYEASNAVTDGSDWSDLKIRIIYPFIQKFRDLVWPRHTAAATRLKCANQDDEIRVVVVWFRYGVEFYSDSAQRGNVIHINKLKNRGDWSWIVFYDNVGCLPTSSSVVSNDCVSSVCIDKN